MVAFRSWPKLPCAWQKNFKCVKISRNTDDLRLHLVNHVNILLRNGDDVFEAKRHVDLHVYGLDFFGFLVDDDDAAFVHAVVQTQARVTRIEVSLFFLLF